MAVKKKDEQLDEVLSRAVGTGASAGANLGAYKDANGKTTTIRPEFAGQTVQVGNQYITYNEKGSPTSATSVSHAQSLGNDYTKKYMGLDQNNTANANDIYRSLYNQKMGNPAAVNGNLINAYGKQNIQYDANLGASDYQSLVQQAASKGNNVLAGFYEDSLNALLNNLGLSNQQTSRYNGGWNYVDNGGGVGNIYAGAARDAMQQDQALGGGWYAGQGLGNAENEYFFRNNDAPTMQEVLAFAKLKGYDVEDENVTLPLTQLANEMMSNGYVSGKSQNAANALGVALPAVLQNLGMSAEGSLGNETLNNTLANMKQNMQQSMNVDDATMQMLYEAASAAMPVQSPVADVGGNYGRTNSYGGSSIDALINQLMGMSYDQWTQGSAYQNLANRYGEQGKQAMQNVLGQMSGRTGGLASSYAQTAAQQQYNDYMSMLDEVARQMYEGDRDNLMQNIDLARDLEQQQYERSIADRNWEYQMQQDAYNRQQDQMAYDRQTAGDMQSRIDAYLAAGGKVANLDPAMIAQSGYTTAELAAMESYYAAQQAAKLRTATPKPAEPAVEPEAESTENEAVKPRASVTNFSYNPMQGKMMWNGKTYTSVEKLQNDIDKAGLTEDEEYLLEMQLRFNGFPVGR